MKNGFSAVTKLSGSWCVIVLSHDGWGRSARIEKTEETAIFEYVLETLARFGEEILDPSESTMTIETVDKRTGGFIKVSIGSHRPIRAVI